MKNKLSIAILLLTLGASTAAQTVPRITEKQAKEFQAKQTELLRWEPWQFVLGTWKGEAKGFVAEGTGEFTFKYDLDRKILIASSSQPFAASPDRPAFTYKSLLIVFLHGLTPRAMLYDNDGHSLSYSVKLSDNPREVTFISDPEPLTPRFRFSYTDNGNDTLKIAFEAALTDKSRTFQPLVEGIARRVK
jgi:hypothetical protein